LKEGGGDAAFFFLSTAQIDSGIGGTEH